MDGPARAAVIGVQYDPLTVTDHAAQKAGKSAPGDSDKWQFPHPKSTLEQGQWVGLGIWQLWK